MQELSLHPTRLIQNLNCMVRMALLICEGGASRRTEWQLSKAWSLACGDVLQQFAVLVMTVTPSGLRIQDLFNEPSRPLLLFSQPSL